MLQGFSSLILLLSLSFFFDCCFDLDRSLNSYFVFSLRGFLVLNLKFRRHSTLPTSVKFGRQKQLIFDNIDLFSQKIFICLFSFLVNLWFLLFDRKIRGANILYYFPSNPKLFRLNCWEWISLNRSAYWMDSITKWIPPLSFQSLDSWKMDVFRITRALSIDSMKLLIVFSLNCFDVNYWW